MDALLLDNSSKRQATFCLTTKSAAFSSICRMDNPDESRFNESLCARVHRLRNERGWTSAQMATALGVPADRYRKYEYRSPLPAYLMERFALIVGCDVSYLLTGKTEKPPKTGISGQKRSA